MAKKYDLVVKTGEYTDQSGATKGRFKNVGVVMEGKDGPYILLDRTFNPAGVPGQDGRESIIVSMYEPRDQAGQQAPVAAEGRILPVAGAEASGAGAAPLADPRAAAGHHGADQQEHQEAQRPPLGLGPRGPRPHGPFSRRTGSCCRGGGGPRRRWGAGRGRGGWGCNRRR